MREEIKLEPCPFCGSEDVTCERFEDVYYVECLSCGAKVESYNGAEAAVACWNARAIDRDELLKVADECERADVDCVTNWAARIRKAVEE
ncbi:MAG: Lar family restriction alleviation protein [Senegalimassilia anaerobia]|nr:Lar family restriction alleviation protein [Senegalimassilia anaerobia]